METESNEESQPSSSTVAEEATPSTSAITPPTEEMEALYSEMDALNKFVTSSEFSGFSFGLQIDSQ